MERTKLSHTVVSEALPRDKQYYVYDTVAHRFALRVLPSGRKSLGYFWTPPGKRPQFASLGDATSLDVEKARDMAVEGRTEARRGNDPTTVAREVKRARKASVGAILAVGGPYEKHVYGRQLHKARSALNTLRTHLKPLWGFDVGKITTADAVGIISGSSNKGDVRKHTRVLLNWAVANGLATSNVLAGFRFETPTRAQRVAKRAAGQMRGRVLPPHEIVKLWQATASDSPFHKIVRFALLAGTRRHEPAALLGQWIAEDHIDAQTQFHYGPSILLPDAITKQGRDHYIPLTPMLHELLGTEPRIGLCFPGPRRGKVINAWQDWVEKLRVDAGLPTFCMHDLRRTAITYMSAIGFDDRVGFVERDALARYAVGHSRTGLSGIYNKDARWAERRQGFERWQAYVAQLVADAEAPAVAEAA